MFDVLRGADTATTVIRKRRASGRGSRPLSFCVAISQPVCNINCSAQAYGLKNWTDSSQTAAWWFQSRIGRGRV